LEEDCHRQSGSVCYLLRFLTFSSHLRLSRWSAKHGECPAGDPDLHHYIGDLLYKGFEPSFILLRKTQGLTSTEGSFEAAEPHFLASGKRDSARLLADMFLQWAEPTQEYGVFALRGVIPCVFSLKSFRFIHSFYSITELQLFVEREYTSSQDVC
jgi:hypothetical protein